MKSTDMDVVVSQSQNEIAFLARQGLDIKPHRARMIKEDLAEKFKAEGDPLRLVFVVGMWMTGFLLSFLVGLEQRFLKPAAQWRFGD